MNQVQLAKTVARELRWIDYRQATIIIKLLFDLIVEGVAIDNEVQLTDFGRFCLEFHYVHKLPPSKLSNNQGSEAHYMYLPRFHPASEFVAELNGKETRAMRFGLAH